MGRRPAKERVDAVLTDLRQQLADIVAPIAGHRQSPREVARRIAGLCGLSPPRDGSVQSARQFEAAARTLLLASDKGDGAVDGWVRHYLIEDSEDRLPGAGDLLGRLLARERDRVRRDKARDDDRKPTRLMLSQDHRTMLDKLRHERGAPNRQDVLLTLIEEAHRALGNQRKAPRKPKPDGGSQQSLPGV